MLYRSLATQIYFYELFFHCFLLLVRLINAYKILFKFIFHKTLGSIIFIILYIQNIDTKSFLYIQWLPFYCLKNDFELAFRLEILECLNSLFLHERCIAIFLNMTISGKVSGGFFSNVDQGKIIILNVLGFTKLYFNKFEI